MWALYDWATSAFATLITTFIFAAYFTGKIALDPVMGTSEWGYAEAVAGIFIAIFSPIFGAIADYSGHRRRWLSFFTWMCVVSSAMLWFAYPDSGSVMWALIWVVIGTIGLEVGTVFYNAMLPHIARPDYVGRISGWAWGFGYFGGLLSLIIALFGFVKHPPGFLDTVTMEHVRMVGPFTALWLAIFSFPLLVMSKQKDSMNYPWRRAVTSGLCDLKNTLKALPKHKQILNFLLARLFYIDGLNTVFAFGGIYAGGTFHMTMSQIIEFGIAMNVSAGIGAFIFAWVDDWWGSKQTIELSLVAVTVLGLAVVLAKTVTIFIAVALVIGLFFGPMQSASRSLMTKLAPKEKSNEFFGLYALSGKVTAFMGPALLAMVTDWADSQRMGVASVLIFFVIGGLILMRVDPIVKHK